MVLSTVTTSPLLVSISFSSEIFNLVQKWIILRQWHCSSVYCTDYFKQHPYHGHVSFIKKLIPETWWCPVSFYCLEDMQDIHFHSQNNSGSNWNKHKTITLFFSAEYWIILYPTVSFLLPCNIAWRLLPNLLQEWMGYVNNLWRFMCSINYN
jgi:hypothetical protein